ncbi:hypothetical protein [Microbacterium enclense]|uniref:hypothetical protein n=1 Tax=Microbacterium enclense TaxID=993073 RepID=UPI003D752651
MDRTTDLNGEPRGFRRPTRVDGSVGDLRIMVGSAQPSRDRPDPAGLAALRSLVGEGEVSSADGGSSRDLSTLTEDSVPPSPKGASDLAGLVGPAIPRSDDHGWMAPELARPGRRPRRGGRGSGGAVGALSIVLSVAAVAMLAGTTTFAIVQRATASPAAEAMESLREREAELRNETDGLRTSLDLMTAVVDQAATLSQSAAATLPGLAGRVEEPPRAAVEASRTALDAVVASVPDVTVPVYERATIDEQSMEAVGNAIDEVRRTREKLPPLIAQVREARSGVSSALDSFRERLRELGASVPATAERLVQTQVAAGRTYRDAVTTAAAGVVSAQQTGSDGLAEMAAFATAVDTLNTENRRVLDEPQVITPVRPPSGGTGVPNAPTDPGESSGTEPTVPDTGDTGGGAPQEQEPAPSPTPTVDPGGTPTP